MYELYLLKQRITACAAESETDCTLIKGCKRDTLGSMRLEVVFDSTHRSTVYTAVVIMHSTMLLRKRINSMIGSHYTCAIKIKTICTDRKAKGFKLSIIRVGVLERLNNDILRRSCY